MAWWDHEELKSLPDRSDKYKVHFPEHYSEQEVIEAAQRLSKTDTMLEQGIADVLANATAAINKEVDMNETRSTQAGRPSPTDTSTTVEDTTIKTINRLQDDLQVAEAEAEYWSARCNDIRLAMKALNALIDKLHENDPREAVPSKLDK